MPKNLGEVKGWNLHKKHLTREKTKKIAIKDLVHTYLEKC